MPGDEADGKLEVGGVEPQARVVEQGFAGHCDQIVPLLHGYAMSSGAQNIGGVTSMLSVGPATRDSSKGSLISEKSKPVDRLIGEGLPQLDGSSLVIIRVAWREMLRSSSAPERTPAGVRLWQFD